MSINSSKYILWFKNIKYRDVPLVGGKNASLGEMFSKLSRRGINIPDGFALTIKAYWHYLRQNGFDKKLERIFRKFDPKSIKSLQATGKLARELILKGKIPLDLEKEIIGAYEILGRKYGKNPDVAVRTSGVAEDTAGASFAGQFETYLNVSGKEKLLVAVRKSIASTFTDRAIAYREEKGFSQLKLGLSVGVQKMVRSDLASSGIIFTLDTESGFKDVVLINSIWGVGEMIVKGKITPDQFYVFKPTLKQGYKPIIIKSLGRKDRKYVFDKGGGLREVKVNSQEETKFSLTDEEILKLARWAIIIEEHYGKAQDIEWAKDGRTGELFIVQSRPETVHAPRTSHFYEEYEIETKKQPIFTGTAIGNKIGKGRVKIIPNVSKIGEFRKGEVLVTRMTDPDWVPIMRLASAIVTEEGGRTCHAAIVSRELGIPAIVGAKNASKILKTGDVVTVDCSSGQGRVFSGEITFGTKRYDLKNIPKLKTKIMVNIGAPDIAFKTSFLPQEGVGLARIEFILAEKIRIHPLALIHYAKIKDRKIKSAVDKLTSGFNNKRQYYINKLAEGISQIASAFYPKPVIVRFSDFKSNEYAQLVGGGLFEPKEANPMLGWRGASRYYDEKFKPAFLMEVEAVKKAREVFGLKNVWVMVPFCRTLKEGKEVLEIIKKNGLGKGKDGLKVIVMCEIPSNVILAEEFLDIFDGMSIGSNDLTQLVLGLDRDSALVSKSGDERNEAVKEMVKEVIKICKKRKKYIGICGQAPSDYLEFAEFLIKEGIDSISLNPDTVVKTIMKISKNKK
ncbi:MAG: phosphoenolpyruvate synthase [Candidatus Pacebacteria bacterium]|nr:phosphoenolpyruvate synthase [Candidatus Paceibacterota bacterium]